ADRTARLPAAEPEAGPRGPRPRELPCRRISAGGQLSDRRPARKRQAQNPRSLVESLPGRIVTRSTDDGNAPICLPPDQVAVTARDDQPEHRRFEVGLGELG